VFVFLTVIVIVYYIQAFRRFMAHYHFRRYGLRRPHGDGGPWVRRAPQTYRLVKFVWS